MIKASLLSLGPRGLRRGCAAPRLLELWVGSYQVEVAALG